ncbi:hypothetical protein [Gallibacterium salpingitidis]|nr:hypothetical protein [Gallibacterium salpingitidis]
MRNPTRKERVARALLNPNGISEREMVYHFNMTSGRNEVNTLEKELNIQFNREWNKTEDGLGQYYKYHCPNRETALKLIGYINHSAIKREALPFTSEQIQHILNTF